VVTRKEILSWLRESDPCRLEQLWQRADQTRRQECGDEVHLRGLVEWSNACARRCAYCGLRADNTSLTRYCMTSGEVVDCARRAEELGYGTVVIQAAEDARLTLELVAEVVRKIKADTTQAVTLSLGERTWAELAAWRDAGADRYLLRFETSDRELFRRIHPPQPGSEWSDRFDVLAALKELDYEVGSGVMVGIPGQSYETLADDIEWFARLDLDMIGLGPYLPHPKTPMGQGKIPPLPNGQQVPNTELMTYKVLALTRLVAPRTNIPSTSALATMNYDGGREGGLMRGANVIMPNVTPSKYRAYYEIYPAKACIRESNENFDQLLRERLESIERRVGTGRGDSPNYHTMSPPRHDATTKPNGLRLGSAVKNRPEQTSFDSSSEQPLDPNHLP